MATLVLVASLLAAWWSFRRKRILAQYGQSETVAAKILERLFEFSASLAIVLLFYHALLGLLAFGWRSINVENLERLEEWFAAAQKTADGYKPKWGMSIGLLVALYLLGCLCVRFLARGTPFRVFKKFKNVLYVINMVVLMLASFTLLGSEAGEAAATLEIRLRQERTEYGLLRREIENVLAGSTVSQVYNNVTNALPGASTVPDLVNNAVNSGASLETTYAEIRKKYDIRDYRIEPLLKLCEAQRISLDRATHTARRGTAPSASEGGGRLPKTITFEGILKAKARVEEFKRRFRPQALRLLDKPGGKEIVLELPEGPVDRLGELFDPVAEAYPVFKPIFEVLKSALTDTIEVALKRKLDDLTDSVAEHPDSIETALPRAAQELGDSAHIQAPPETTRIFRRNLSDLQRQVAQIRKSSEQLQQTALIAEARANERVRRAEAHAKQQEQARIRGAVQARASRPNRGEPRVEPYLREPGQPRFTSPLREPVLGPGFIPNAGSTCICNTYRNGILVSSVPIPVGARCGGQVCGRP